MIHASKENSKTYFGTGLTNSTFASNCVISRVEMDEDEIRARISRGFISCFKPGDTVLIKALHSRFGINVSIPKKIQNVSVGYADAIIVVEIHGLPKLTRRYSYTNAEIKSAKFSFILYTAF